MRLAGKQRFSKPYIVLMCVLGLCAVVLSLEALPISRIDLRFMLLASMTLTIGARISIKIPRAPGHISVSDTFVFLTIFLFGGEAAVLLATLDALVTSLRITKKSSTLIFNCALMAVSTFATCACVKYFCGDIVSLTDAPYSPLFMIAASIMASVQYVINSGTVALAGALRRKAVGQVLPACAAAEYPENAIHHFTGVSPRPATSIVSARQFRYQWLNKHPLFIS